MAKAALQAKVNALTDLSMIECIDRCKATLEYANPPEPLWNKDLKGHTQKVYDVSFSSDCTHVATAGQEGLVFVTNVYTGLKTAKPCKASFVMACALNSNAKLVATGGMENTITMTSIATPLEPTTKKQMTGHEGYISKLAFVDDGQLLSTSGDGLAILWDVQTGQQKSVFSGHFGDCNALALAADKPGIFATGSADRTARVWDVRTGKCTRTFEASDEVNAVALFPNGEGLATGNDNGQTHFFCVKSNALVGTGKPKNLKIRCMSIAIGRSGRYTYAGMTTGQMLVADTFAPGKWKLIKAHENYLSAMSIARDGATMVTGSYDSMAKVWTGGDGIITRASGNPSGP
mmetsp:Transcript_28402/g.59700  ORF Transcript_28402/g.59700 Transcript_28402/m.59700 type:complete len:347 (-) Transcript_28402:549-1589(-)